MRVLLVQMPFFRLESPCLGLELLDASLRQVGIKSEVAYLNLDLGRRIGKLAYTWIAERSPRYLLLGDLIFAPSLHGEPIGLERVEALRAGLGRRRESELPAWLLGSYPELVQAAKDLLDEARREIDWSAYDLVGVGTLFQVVPALALARAIKSLPGAPPILLGGSHCEGEMGEAIHRSFPFIDFVCRGEGEELIVELARHLRDGQIPLEEIRGLLWREGGETCGAESGRASLEPATGPAPTRSYPLDRLPVPRYDTWLERVGCAGLLEPAELRLPIETSRGCWYGERRHCLYCGFTGEAMRFRSKSPERILEELRTLIGTGVRFLHCVDNIPDPRSFESVLPELACFSHGCQIFWEVMPNLDRRQVKLLFDAGIHWVQAGIESLSTRVLRLMGKGTSALQNVRFLKYAAQHGIGASWSLLFGFVGEDPEDYRQIQELMPALAHLQPPYQDHQHVRVDRFSPLFETRRGLKGVAPTPAYHELFHLDPGTVARLAYYFDYEYVDHPDPYLYTRGCEEEMERWRRGTGSAALICFSVGSTLQLRDTRSVAVERQGVLRGLDREVFLAAEHGASLATITARTRATPAEVEAVLAPLLARRWLVELDGRFLSLAVPVDDWIPRGVPPILVADALLAEYCRRMVKLRDGFYAEDARPVGAVNLSVG